MVAIVIVVVVVTIAIISCTQATLLQPQYTSFAADCRSVVYCIYMQRLQSPFSASTIVTHCACAWLSNARCLFALRKPVITHKDYENKCQAACHNQNPYTAGV